MSEPPLIEARGLGVWYRLTGGRPADLKGMLLRGRLHADGRTFWALRDVDLTCRPGQVLGLVGPNGAGKSTLCLVLSQVLSPDRGKVIVRGKVSPLLSLGAGFNLSLSGRDNVLLYGALLGIPRRTLEDRYDEIIEVSGVAEFINEPLRHYSSGMRARLGFAVATVQSPEILILDEVLSVGDKQFREKSRKTIEQMMAGSKLIIVASHNTATLSEICTHCMWLQEGGVVRYGTAASVLEEYDGRPPGT